MAVYTIHFDNLREAQELTGLHHRLLPRMEEDLGVRLVARDTWLQVEGEDDAVLRARTFFEFLRRVRHKGATLDRHGILYTLRVMGEGRMEDLHRMYSCRIQVSPEKPVILPRTLGQQHYIQSIRDRDLVFGLGPAGTGKTYLAMAMAISALVAGEVSRVILTRPAIEAGEALGFLPGDMHQKIMPYLKPLYDALHDMMPAELIEKHTERGVIEVAPLAYMRGRTLNHAFVILDEAQNTTGEQMLMFLTRLGFDSKCVVTGDLSQIDLPASRQSGLKEARSLLTGIRDINIVEFGEADVVRHELVQKIIRAYRVGRSDPAEPPAPSAAPSSPPEPDV